MEISLSIAEKIQFNGRYDVTVQMYMTMYINTVVDSGKVSLRKGFIFP